MNDETKIENLARVYKTEAALVGAIENAQYLLSKGYPGMEQQVDWLTQALELKRSEKS